MSTYAYCCMPIQVYKGATMAKQQGELTAAEVAAILGVAEVTVRLYEQKGLLTGRRETVGLLGGRRVYYSAEEVAALVRRQAENAA